MEVAPFLTRPTLLHEKLDTLSHTRHTRLQTQVSWRVLTRVYIQLGTCDGTTCEVAQSKSMQ